MSFSIFQCVQAEGFTICSARTTPAPRSQSRTSRQGGMRQGRRAKSGIAIIQWVPMSIKACKPEITGSPPAGIQTQSIFRPPSHVTARTQRSETVTDRSSMLAPTPALQPISNILASGHAYDIVISQHGITCFPSCPVVDRRSCTGCIIIIITIIIIPMDYDQCGQEGSWAGARKLSLERSRLPVTTASGLFCTSKDRVPTEV